MSSPGVDPRLDAAIDALDVVKTQRRILRALAVRDRHLHELALALELTLETTRHHLAELMRRYLVTPTGGGYGLAASWVRSLGVGDGRPPCVPS